MGEKISVLKKKYILYICANYFAKLSTNLLRNMNAIGQSVIDMKTTLEAFQPGTQQTIDSPLTAHSGKIP